MKLAASVGRPDHVSAERHPENGLLIVIVI